MGSQQFHLDVHVDDITAAEREVLALGAVRIPDVGNEGPEDPFRVFRDPAGHTLPHLGRPTGRWPDGLELKRSESRPVTLSAHPERG
jgi:hypothetical protein